MRACEHCGTPLPSGSRSTRKFCSDSCKLQAHRRRHDPLVGSEGRQQRKLDAINAYHDVRWAARIHGDLVRAGLEPGTPRYQGPIGRHDGRPSGRAAHHPPPKPRPDWVLSLEDFLAGHAEINGRRSRIQGRPAWTLGETLKWIAAALLLGDHLNDEMRRRMSQIASIDRAELQRLERRVSRLENTLSDFAHETEQSAAKVRSRLESLRGRTLREIEKTRAMLDERAAR